MSTFVDQYADEQPLADELSYRAVSRPAIISLVLALVSLAGLMFPALLALAAVGLILAIVGLVSIRRYPQELSGAGAAVAGIVLCSLVLIGGTTMHTIIYLTEVPEGYERISFSELEPDKSSGLPFSRRAADLNKQDVFIKGYIHPGVTGLGPVDSFVLVEDMGTCCFGGQPKLEDMIEVRLVDGKQAQYSTRKRKLAGVFKVSPAPKQKAAGGLTGGFFQLEAGYIK